MPGRLSNSFGTILNNCANFARALLPQQCLLCAAASGSSLLCQPCHARLPALAADRCPQCALPTSGGEVCGHCLRHPPAFDHTLAAFSYRFPVDALVQALKYEGNLAIAGILAEPLAALAAARPAPDALVALPLHPERLRERGFNQSLEIARFLSRELGIPLLACACQRIRATAPQAGLPWQERAGNVRGAFACQAADLEGKSIAVVDDVMTTGATMDELCRVLRAAGAREVGAWVVTRTLKPD